MMRIIRNIKTAAARILALFLCVLVPFAACTALAASSTEDGAAGVETVYLAGAPEDYPLEWYDMGEGIYKGVLPGLLTEISRDTGLSFSYIRAGEEDRRIKLAKNSQVDMLFAHGDEERLLSFAKDKILVFSLSDEEKSGKIYLAFFDNAKAEDIRAIKACVSTMTASDSARLFTIYGGNGQNVVRQFHTVVILAVSLGLAVLAIGFLVVLFAVNRRNDRKTILTDAKTHIGNRAFFTDRFSALINDGNRESYYLVLFSFNVDKVIQNYGVDEADDVILYAADTVKEHTKKNEFCARVDDTSIAAAIFCSGAEQAESRVDDLLRVLNAYGGKYLGAEKNVVFRGGICPLAADDRDAERPLFNSRRAYELAVSGKRPFVFVNRDVIDREQTKAAIRAQLPQAISSGQFLPYVQFIVDTKGDEIWGGELLSRWQNPVYGLLYPGDFISAVSDMGLSGDYDLMMLEHACRLLEDWTKRGVSYYLTFNLSRITISDKEICQKILSVTDRFAFPREKLVLEVVEDCIEEDKATALRSIRALKKEGFRIALDDFPSGVTSVQDLYEYSVNIVKLDRQLFMMAERDEKAVALVSEIAKMNRGLNIEVVGEGIENAAQDSIARAVGCRYIQGYYYARPLPLQELEEFQRRYRKGKNSL